MSGPVNDGGPAFPVILFDGQDLGDGTANGMIRARENITGATK